MAGGANRTALRQAVKSAMDGLPRMMFVPHRDILAMRPDIESIPERMVAVPIERPEVLSAAGTDRNLTLEVVVRRKGEDAQDALDADQDEIEPAVIAAVEMGNTTCDLIEVRFAFDTDSATPLAQMTLSFAVLQFD